MQKSEHDTECLTIAIPRDTVTLLAEKGLFDTAISLALLHKLSLTGVFECITKKALMPQLQSSE